jgi:methylmalonyl-CoA decarboxylase subunit alpha
MTTPSTDDAVPEEIQLIERLRGLRQLVTTHMGGPEVVDAIHAAGRPTARDHIAALVDAGSFFEIGTFATFTGKVTAENPGNFGGGIIGGHATLDGRPVTVAVDDDSVALPATRGTGKAARLFQMAMQRRHPYIEIAQGDAEPELGPQPGKAGTESARTFGAEPGFPYLLTRNRAIPVVSAVLGDAWAASSFSAGLCDFLIQLQGTSLGLARPEPPATGDDSVLPGAGSPVRSDASKAAPSAAGKLGSAAGNAASGLVDAVAVTPDEAYAAIRRFLSYLPSHAGGALPAVECELPLADDDEMAAIVPARRSRAYDMKAVIRRLADPGSFLELKPAYARSIITGFTRLGGIPVGVVANAPMRMAGGLTPESCMKAVSFICLCDGFGIPLLILQDTPGFLVSAAAERDRAVVRVMTLFQALSLATVPRISVVIRKAFGLAFLIQDAGRAADLSLAWPGAEIGFMDPPVAANVLFEPQARELPEEERAAFLAGRAGRLLSPPSAAGHSRARITPVIVR